MVNKLINPFQNESDTLQLGDLTIENRVDRMSFYGSLDITRDKIGLENAQQLKSIIEMIVGELESSELPDQITIEPTDTVNNPFL